MHSAVFRVFHSPGFSESRFFRVQGLGPGFRRSRFANVLNQFLILHPWKIPWNWIAFYWNSFVISLGLMRGETGGLANEVYFSNSIVFLSSLIWRGITSIRRRPNFDEFPRHFRVLFRCNFDGRKIHVVSTYFFRCNFDGRKIHVVSTYFFWCNFDGRKIHNVSTYFFRCNFSRRNIHDDSTYFFRLNFDGRNIHFICTYFFDKISMKSTSFLVSCKLMKTFEGVFLC